MDENPFADLIPKGSDNPFSDLIPKKEDAKTAAPPSIADAVTDIPKEIGAAYSQGAQHLTGNSVADLPGYDPRTRGELGPVEGLLRTGKQIIGLPEIAASAITGAARSIGGHLMAQGEHAVGTLINPDAAAKDDPQKMYETAKGDVDTAMSAARPAGAPVKVGGAYEWKAPTDTAQSTAPSIAELKAAASGKPGAAGGYEGTELSDLQVKPTAITDFATKTKMALDAAGLDENLAPKTHAILSKVETPPPGPTIVTGKNIMSLRKLLGNAAGEPGQEGLAASRAQQALDDHIPNISPQDVIAGNPKAAGDALETANGNYAAAKQSEAIDNKRISAELRASSNNSGINVANSIRQNLRAVVDPTRPKEGRGLSPDELSAAQTVVEGTKPQNAMRTAGNYLGKLQGTAIGGVVGSVFGPVGAAVGAALPSTAGFLLKSLANRMTVQQAQQLSEMIRSRAPLSSSLNKFNQSAQALSSGRTPKTYAAAYIAARNLSNNLKGVVDLSPSDLMRGIQGPSPSGAQDEHQ